MEFSEQEGTVSRLLPANAHDPKVHCGGSADWHSGERAKKGSAGLAQGLEASGQMKVGALANLLPEASVLVGLSYGPALQE